MVFTEVSVQRSDFAFQLHDVQITGVVRLGFAELQKHRDDFLTGVVREAWGAQVWDCVQLAVQREAILLLFSVEFLEQLEDLLVVFPGSINDDSLSSVGFGDLLFWVQFEQAKFQKDLDVAASPFNGRHDGICQLFGIGVGDCAMQQNH